MNPTELELFLYRHTESESWHLQHPGQLSHLYDKMKQEEFRGEVGYCFDFVNTLKKDMIGMIKETRFTVIPKHHHVDMELNYIYSGSCTFVINGREITLKKAICAFWTVTFGTAPPAIKRARYRHQHRVPQAVF